MTDHRPLEPTPPLRTRRDFVATSLKGAALMAGAPIAGLGIASKLDAFVSGSHATRARAGHGGPARLADAHIEIVPTEPIGTIAPEIYGHFTEHLGGVIYDGVWVGEDSSIPNVGGVRKALIDAMKKIRPAVVRWPGGCFADSYDWRDGVGDPAKRPRRTNVWVDSREIHDLGNVQAKFDNNRFGTNEFMRFARLVGAQPYMAANVRSLPPRVFFEWVEYCNSPKGSTTLADLRATGGDPDPFNARYWGVGNESWGCGGNFTPEEYAEAFRRFATWPVPDYGVGLRFVASGPSGDDRNWTRKFLEQVAKRNDLGRVWGLALHHYCSSPQGEAVAFDETAWYELLTSANLMETLIGNHWEIMGEVDRRRRTKLVVDEWGAWHHMTTNVDPTHLFGQQSTVRDAVVAGLTLDTFNRHADKVAMANIAQLINCIQSLFLAHEDKFILTPTYHVFDMYAAHQGATSMPVQVAAPEAPWKDRDGNAKSLRALGASASVPTEGRITLTVTNQHMTQPMATEIEVLGATVRSARATTLTHADVHAHNTFDAPDVVTPTAATNVDVGSGTWVYAFPPASVTKLEIGLG
ncbi:MAG: alpha-L-arabinofuranosidase [Gemmatimonadetes bacterium]|nr:alpha-L-arabinofuranosidase [Gemmatimonadota bacterium]